MKLSYEPVMTAADNEITLVPLSSSMAPAVQRMTFPAYRHLLSMTPSVRHPDDGDTRRVQPIAVVAMVGGASGGASGGAPVGLALAEYPLNDGRPEAQSLHTPGPELLSLSVDAPFRRRGIGTALVAAIECECKRVASTYADAGTHAHAPRHTRLDAVYMTGKGKADVTALERIFVKRGWHPPAVRTYTLRFTVDEAARMPWFGRVPLRDRDFEWFAWTDLRSTERAALIASQAARPWIPEGLEFWRHDCHGFDPVSSLGLRYRGDVVGWTINHRLAADTTRISGAFVRDDLSRRGRLMALWTESITRMRAGGVRWISSITPVQLRPMVEFLSRRCAPWATFSGETRGTHKRLA